MGFENGGSAETVRVTIVVADRGKKKVLLKQHLLSAHGVVCTTRRMQSVAERRSIRY